MLKMIVIELLYNALNIIMVCLSNAFHVNGLNNGPCIFRNILYTKFYRKVLIMQTSDCLAISCKYFVNLFLKYLVFLYGHVYINDLFK